MSPLARASDDRVAAWMQRRFVDLAPSHSLTDARELMRLARVRHLLVVDEGRLVGILSYRDVLEAAFGVVRPRARPPNTDGKDDQVASLMTPAPATLRPSASLREAAACMLRLHVGCLPVVEGDGDAPRLVGILTESDLLRAAYVPRPAL